MKILIRNGTVLSPPLINGEVLDILIQGSRIREIGSAIRAEGALEVDAKGLLVVPGLVDVHVHFRQPGFEYKEDILTGSQAAAAGGFTTVVAEPNTIPPVDTPARLRQILKIAERSSVVNYFSKASITRGMKGDKLVDVEGMKAAGAVAISEDGNPVSGRLLMRNALMRAAECGIPVSPHCEESAFYRKKMSRKYKEKVRDGFLRMPYSETSIPYTSEHGLVKRDIELAEETGAHIHISHVSLARSVEEIARARARNVNVTAEAAPHHFLLTKAMEKEVGTNAKMNPPLRSADDVETIRKGLADGTIDIIASDHAPHSPKEKNAAWKMAPFGIIGLETTLGLVLTHLVKTGILTLEEAIKKMTSGPAKIFGLDKTGIGTLKRGKRADVVIIDTKKRWTVRTDTFYSKGRNCPFDGWRLQGRAVMTIVGGKIIMKNGRVMEIRRQGRSRHPGRPA
ncbi:dihydroorotase [Thermodesulfobacteriota bacterium]